MPGRILRAVAFAAVTAAVLPSEHPSWQPLRPDPPGYSSSIYRLQVQIASEQWPPRQHDLLAGPPACRSTFFRLRLGAMVSRKHYRQRSLRFRPLVAGRKPSRCPKLQAEQRVRLVSGSVDEQPQEPLALLSSFKGRRRQVASSWCSSCRTAHRCGPGQHRPEPGVAESHLRKALCQYRSSRDPAREASAPVGSKTGRPATLQKISFVKIVVETGKRSIPVCRVDRRRHQLPEYVQVPAGVRMGCPKASAR